MSPRAHRPKPLKQGRSESQVTAEVLDAARLFGIILTRRNVGMAFNAAGKAVRFGTPGEPDWDGTFCGRRISVEIKHELFDPTKLRGTGREHFQRQLDVMRGLNAAGGFAFWVRSGSDAAEVFQKLADVPGLTVLIDQAGWCYTDDGAEA